MTFVIGLMKYRNLNSPLIRIFYRDGFFYFLVLSGETFDNLQIKRPVAEMVLSTAISAGNITADLVGPVSGSSMILKTLRGGLIITLVPYSPSTDS